MEHGTKIKLATIAALSAISLTALANSQIVGVMHCPSTNQLIFEGGTAVSALDGWFGMSLLPASDAKKWKLLINKVDYSAFMTQPNCYYTINDERAVILWGPNLGTNYHLYKKKQRVDECVDDPRNPNQPCYWYKKSIY